MARLGGDEFVVVLSNLVHAEDAGVMAKKILGTFNLPFVVAGRELHVTSSIGVSIHPEDGDNADALLRSADAAMYRAKEQGRANFQFYTQEMSVHAQQRIELETALRLAVERQEFELHYQPQVNSKPTDHCRGTDLAGAIPRSARCHRLGLSDWRKRRDWIH